MFFFFFLFYRYNNYIRFEVKLYYQITFNSNIYVYINLFIYYFSLIFKLNNIYISDVTRKKI